MGEMHKSLMLCFLFKHGYSNWSSEQEGFLKQGLKDPYWSRMRRSDGGMEVMIS